jgi:hypothetical protein
MGLFSKKKKVTVGVTAVRMADKVDNPYKQAVLTSVLSGKSVAETFKSENLHGFYAKSEAFYRYGKNNYIHGLPEGFKTYTDINTIKVSQVLSRIFSQPAAVSEAFTSFGDPVYFAHVDIQVRFLYNPATGLISKPPIAYPLGTKVKVLNITIGEVGYSIDVEISKIPLLVTDPVPAKEYATYTGSFTYDKDKTYLHVKYQLPADVTEGNYRYWYYDVLSSTYPEINTILNESWDSPFYPLVPIRENKVNTIDTGNKKNIENILNKLNIKLDSVTEAIMSREDGNNPDLVDECFIGFFANLDTEQEVTKLYLWEFFSELASTQIVTKPKFDAWKLNRQGVDTPQESITIKEKDFNIRLLWNYINITTKAGTIGKIGSVTMSRELRPRNNSFGSDFEESALVITKQITGTQVKEIVVHGLEHLTDVYEGSLHSTTLADLDDEDKKYGFFIPISRNIINKIPFQKRAELMMDCLTIVLYAVQISYVKWYQRGFFKILITIIIIVISIYLGDWSGTFAQGFWAAATAIASNIIVNMIIMKGLEIVAGMIGGELAAIIAVAVAIYAMTSPNPSLFGLSDTTSLLKASTLAIEASNKVTADEFKKIMSSSEDLLKSVKEKQEEIKKAYDMLDPDNKIDFFDIRKGGFYFNPDETPSQYFERTINLKNPGTMAYDELEYYYETALKLSVRPQWEF